MVTVKHALFSWGEGDTDETLSIAVGDRDPAETQRPLGPVHTRNETEYAQSLAGLAAIEGLLELLLRFAVTTSRVLPVVRHAGKVEISSSTKQGTSVRSSFFPSSTYDWNKDEDESKHSVPAKGEST
jgi:hypothetical protein